MNPNVKAFRDHPVHFWVPVLVFSGAFLYALVSWSLPWRLAFFVGVFFWAVELFVHRAFIGSY